MSAPSPQTNDSRSGFILALITYVMWGALPLFFKLTGHIHLAEIIAHRILWSLPIALIVLALLGKLKGFKEVVTSPKIIRLAILPALFVTLNWSIYVWAVFAGHALDAALGYYINPLLSVLVAAIFLGEKLNKGQWAAMGFAAIGVAILTWENGHLPFVALALSLTWAFYAYCKRALPLEPTQGFTVEMMLLFPFALVLGIYLMANGQSHLFLNMKDTLLLMACGLVTAGPLILYANSAKRLRLSTIAMMQYISPSMIFLLAVFIFKEPFTSVKLLAFGFIWGGLIIFTLATLRKR